MITRKSHCPSLGEAVGLSGPALCGRWATYYTGDHAAIRRSWVSSLKDDDVPYYYCRLCVRLLAQQVQR